MSERFKLQHINDLTDQEYMRLKKITDNGELITLGEVVDLLNEQQTTIEEYKDFCLNLCKFVIQKDLVDEYREKYGKEYKIITKWWNDE